MTGKYSRNSSTSCVSVLLNSHPHFTLSVLVHGRFIVYYNERRHTSNSLLHLCSVYYIKTFPTFSPGHYTLCSPPPSLSSSTPPYRFLVCFSQALVLGRLRLLISLRSLFISMDLTLTTMLTTFSSHGKLYGQTLPGSFCQYSGNFAAQFHGASFLGILDVQHKNPDPGPETETPLLSNSRLCQADGKNQPAQPWWIQVCSGYAVSRRQFLSISPNYWLLHFFLLFLEHSLILGWSNIDIPFRAEHSPCTYSPYFDQLWISALTAACHIND